MKDEEFNQLANQTRLSRASREAARQVLVDGRRASEVADAVGLSKQRLSQILGTLRKVELEQQPAAPSLVDQLHASYAHAVKLARDHCGDAVMVQQPRDAGRTLGEVIARTDYHLVQDLGRQAVAIHDLARLERVPALGQLVSIQYEAGHGRIVERERDRSRGGRER